MKLNSLTIFFPFFNDEGTVLSSISDAYKYGFELTQDLEVIAIHGGPSIDNTFEKIYDAKSKFPDLVIIDKSDNVDGYSVIRFGFEYATKDWVFYTDGDAQYSLTELKNLVREQNTTDADVINGYKTSRGDNFVRTLLGNLYAKLSSFIFQLPVRDTDCDFRLIRTSYLKKINLISRDSSILGELLKKLQLSGAKFSEIPVSHFNRVYGKSNYTPVGLLKEKLFGDIQLYFKLRKHINKYPNMRLIKFSFVGLSSVIIQLILFNLIILNFEIQPFWASIFADQFAIINSFLLNNMYTFKDKKFVSFNSKIRPFIKFYSIVIISTFFQAFLVWMGNYLFGYSVIVSNLFFILGIFFGFIINYSLQKRIVWK